MSTPQQPRPAKLFVSLFMRRKQLLRPLIDGLTDRFGPIDLIGPWFDFDFTDYYRREMGAPLFRRAMVFESCVSQGSLAAIKLETNRIEGHYSENGRRQVNIDPGLLSHERFVLATTKNFTHRIYIGEGIYADLTLIYTRGGFQPLPWTYPDYKEPGMHLFLTRSRNKYIADLKLKTKEA